MAHSFRNQRKSVITLVSIAGAGDGRSSSGWRADSAVITAAFDALSRVSESKAASVALQVIGTCTVGRLTHSNSHLGSCPLPHAFVCHSRYLLRDPPPPPHTHTPHARTPFIHTCPAHGDRHTTTTTTTGRWQGLCGIACTTPDGRCATQPWGLSRAHSSTPTISPRPVRTHDARRALRWMALTTSPFRGLREHSVSSQRQSRQTLTLTTRVRHLTVRCQSGAIETLSKARPPRWRRKGEGGCGGCCLQCARQQTPTSHPR
jgi:hypothetical protein